MPPQTASGGISRERFKLGSSNFAHLLRTRGPTKVPERASTAPSGRLHNAIKYYSEMVRDTAKDKCTVASKASSNFLSEEYRHSFQIERRGVSPTPTLWWASCRIFAQISS